MNAVAAILWTVFATLVLTGGAVSLRACGFWTPWSLDACPRSAPPGEAALAAERREALIAERDRLIAAANLAPQCRIPAAAEPEPEPEPQQDASCQPPPTGEVVVLLDVSFSMEFDFLADQAVLARMDALWDQISGSPFPQPGAASEYERLSDAMRRSPGEDRIDVARGALAELGRATPPETNLTLLSFAQCGVPPRREGVFPGGAGGAFEAAVRNLRLRPSTALAEAIAALPRHTEAGRSAEDPVNIVIVTDGEDSCGGDPCAAARAMKAELPFARVSVISVAQQANANACVAEGAGGTFHYAAEIEEVARSLRQATGQLSREECAALTASPGAANDGGPSQ